MKILITIAVVCLPFASVASADEYVNGYYKNNGTYVGGHYRSSRDSSFSNNYSTEGNYNPYTGKSGTKTYNNCSYSSFC